MTKQKTPTKIQRVLAHLMSGASLNRFDAERIGDHTLNSTIAVLANQYKLDVKRQRERVPHRFGTLTDVTPHAQRRDCRDCSLEPAPAADDLESRPSLGLW